MEKLSIKECVRFGWETFKKRPGIFIIAILVVIAVQFVVGILQGALESTDAGLASLLSFAISMIVGALVSMGLYAFTLKAHDNVAEASVRDLWHPKPFVPFLATYILLSIVLTIGFILLIVPGIILGIIFGFALYLVIDRNAGIIESFKESARITKGNRWNLFLLGLVFIGINIVGALALLVGLLVSIPVTMLAMTHAYRKLASEASAPAVVVDVEPVAIA